MAVLSASRAAGRAGQAFGRWCSTAAPAAGSGHYAFHGASEERKKRLRELSSPGQAPDSERKQLIDEIIRIDHAGEYGAVQIYKGQVRKTQA